MESDTDTPLHDEVASFGIEPLLIGDLRDQLTTFEIPFEQKALKAELQALCMLHKVGMLNQRELLLKPVANLWKKPAKNLSNQVKSQGLNCSSTRKDHLITVLTEAESVSHISACYPYYLY